MGKAVKASDVSACALTCDFDLMNCVVCRWASVKKRVGVNGAFCILKCWKTQNKQTEKKKTEKEKNSQYFFGLIQIKLKMTWTPEQPQWSAAGHESKISMTGQSWDVNRRRVPAGKREAAGWTGKANSRRNRHGCTQRGRWWSYRTNERLHGSHEGILNAWQPAKGSNVADEM